jgi:hypothetical protein
MLPGAVDPDHLWTCEPVGDLLIIIMYVCSFLATYDLLYFIFRGYIMLYCTYSTVLRKSKKLCKPPTNHTFTYL